MERYRSLNKAKVDYHYLHTNSTTHVLLFGAIVEMVDNAKDANAESCRIFTVDNPDVRGEKILCFLDDGSGMTIEESRAVMTFGHSSKRSDPNMIGQYGNGLKSGSMRIGKDFVIFTKRDGFKSCIFLSDTFHNEFKPDEIIVANPSFSEDCVPIARTADDRAKHDLEMDMIFNYSPFRDYDTFHEQFDRIEGESGTVVMIFNLKEAYSGHDVKLELDFTTDPTDIRLLPTDGDNRQPPEYTSLRAYLAILYSAPRMKIYINDVKVRTKRIVDGLYKPKQYPFTSTRFKAQTEAQIKELQKRLIAAKEDFKGEDIKFQRETAAFKNLGADRQERRKNLEVLLDSVRSKKQEIVDLEKEIQNQKKSLSTRKTLCFQFGVNLEHRARDGCFIYNNGRLIKMYERLYPQKRSNNIHAAGVVGVVDVPFTIMEPTHNKQGFDSREYQQLLRDLGEFMESYWFEFEAEHLTEGNKNILEFWKHYGYSISPADWWKPPSSDDVSKKRRRMKVKTTLQCDSCLKWREILPSAETLLQELPDDWTCSDNNNVAQNKCSFSEKPITIPEGKFKKRTAEKRESNEAHSTRESKVAKQNELNGDTDDSDDPSTESAHRVLRNNREVPLRDVSRSHWTGTTKPKTRASAVSTTTETYKMLKKESATNPNVDDAGTTATSSNCETPAYNEQNVSTQLARKLKTVLIEYCPQDYKLNKEAIQKLTVAELLHLDTDTFFEAFQATWVKALNETQNEKFHQMKRLVAQAIRVDLGSCQTADDLIQALRAYTAERDNQK